MTYARFTTQKGGHEFSGPATVKAKTIEVESSAFGKLIFDRATGKAKGGTAQIQNLGEVLASAPPAEVGPVTKNVVWMIVTERHRRGDENEFKAVVSIAVTKDNQRTFVGIIETLEEVYGKPRHAVGQTIEYTRERYGPGVPERFETREAVIEKLASGLVDDAETYLKDADKWALKFGPKELGFVPHLAIRSAIRDLEVDHSDGYSRRSYRRIILDDEGGKRDKKFEVVTQANLLALLIDRKRPQMSMV